MPTAFDAARCRSSVATEFTAHAAPHGHELRHAGYFARTSTNIDRSLLTEVRLCIRAHDFRGTLPNLQGMGHGVIDLFIRRTSLSHRLDVIVCARLVPASHSAEDFYKTNTNAGLHLAGSSTWIEES